MFTSLFTACCVSTVLVASTVLYLLGCGLKSGVQSPGRIRTPKNSVFYIPVQCDFKCYKLVHNLSSKYCSYFYSDVA